ncbi:hypothetical protein ACFLXJ_02570 [Chloroflexota bacterium]
MRNKWIKRIFPFFALTLLLPWPIAYAFDNNAAGQETVKIEVADESAKPTSTAFGQSISGIDPGELFRIDASSNTADIVVTLYLTNAEKLINYHRFMTLNVGVYVENNGEWERAYGSDGNQIQATVLSMKNGQVSFVLPGYAKYMIGVDSGAFFCRNANADASSLSPRFYLEVN